MVMMMGERTSMRSSGTRMGDGGDGSGSGTGCRPLSLAATHARAAAAALAFGALCSSVVAAVVVYAWWVALPALAVSELAVFPLLWVRKWRRFNAQPTRHRPHESVDPRDVFDRFVKQQAKLSKYICIQKMLRKWFKEVPLEDIKRGNVADLLCYGFWYRSPAQLAEEFGPELPDQLVSEIEAAWGVSFGEGYNAGLPFMAHLWQDLRCNYRPMLFYIGIEALFALKHCLLLATGFRAAELGGFVYYSRGLPPAPARDGCSSPTPVLFLHGVGLGLLPYLPFVWRLATTAQPVLAVESNHLGMRWVDGLPEADDVVDAIVAILDAEKVDRVAVCSHSYGTFMSSRLVQRFPSRVQSLALIDPVCFVMFSGKLILNFVYQPHHKAITTGIVARDIHHAASVCRSFFWSLLNLWPDQLPDRTLVVLSGRDELVPVAEVIRMLEEESSAHVLYHDHHCHAEFIKDTAWQARVVDRVARMATAPPGSASPFDAAEVDHTGERMLTGLDMADSIMPDSHHTLVRNGSLLRRHARSDSASSYETFRKQQAQLEGAADAAAKAGSPPPMLPRPGRHKRAVSVVPLPSAPLVQL